MTQAVRDGAWLLVDGVNICTASVLDRLNAMLEPGGVLTLSERGVIDGSIPNVIPHKDFRLFLTMNPQHGEISRLLALPCLHFISTICRELFFHVCLLI